MMTCRNSWRISPPIKLRLQSVRWIKMKILNDISNFKIQGFFQIVNSNYQSLKINLKLYSQVVYFVKPCSIAWNCRDSKKELYENAVNREQLIKLSWVHTLQIQILTIHHSVISYLVWLKATKQKAITRRLI